MTPTIGRIVPYVLRPEDCDQITYERMSAGARTKSGNPHEPGQEVPLLIAVVWPGGAVNGQAILDGNHTLWITSAQEGTGPGTWHWPVRQEEKMPESGQVFIGGVPVGPVEVPAGARLAGEANTDDDD